MLKTGFVLYVCVQVCECTLRDQESVHSPNDFTQEFDHPKSLAI